MKLNPDDPGVWDKWRELYGELTNHEQREFANACEERYPTQTHFNWSNVQDAIELYPKHQSILEIGGWKGEMAQRTLMTYPDIKSWVNIEFCTNAVAKTVDMTGLPYTATVPPKFNWFKNIKAGEGFDMCVSTHTIEHFSDEHFKQLVECLVGIPVILFEAPIGMGKSNWSGYMGTHKLEMGWVEINELMALVHGYTVRQMTPECYVYEL